MRAFIEEHRTQTTPFDIIVEGETAGDDPENGANIIRGWEESGATWWIETISAGGANVYLIANGSQSILIDAGNK